uniref:Uncharacterized protein n=1 Tax=Octopus bimaculoides TaxID=37653 RepID=A0A0L8HDS3_OCTBM
MYSLLCGTLLSPADDQISHGISPTPSVVVITLIQCQSIIKLPGEIWGCRCLRCCDPIKKKWYCYHLQQAIRINYEQNLKEEEKVLKKEKK